MAIFCRAEFLLRSKHPRCKTDHRMRSLCCEGKPSRSRQRTCISARRCPCKRLAEAERAHQIKCVQNKWLRPKQRRSARRRRRTRLPRYKSSRSALRKCRRLSEFIKLVSAGFLEGFYYKPRIDHDLLAKHSKGLIALSACLSGEVNESLLDDGGYEKARNIRLSSSGNFRQRTISFSKFRIKASNSKRKSIRISCGSPKKLASRWWPPTTATI